VKAVFLLGPTASGKTAIALELAARFPQLLHHGVELLGQVAHLIV